MSTTYVYDAKLGGPAIPKTPLELLDYSFDFTEYMVEISDAISSATFTLTGVTFTSQQHSPTIATVWVEGGVVGTTASIRCVVTTAGGRRIDRTIFIKIQGTL